MKQLIECSKCKYAIERKGNWGTYDCHRYPPEGLTEWPIVRKDNWCGEFMPTAASTSQPNSTRAALTIMDKWNKIPGVSGCRQWSTKRATSLRSRMADPLWFNMALEAIEKIGTSRFLVGGGNTGWKANIDWFLRPDTVVKILEDQYQDTAPVEENPLQTTEQFFGK